MIALTRMWILLSVLLVSAGWLLSAIHQLNRQGYLATLALAGIAGFLFRRKTAGKTGRHWARDFHKLWRRLRRPLPRLFLLMALATLAAGMMYPTPNGDSMSYRIPRVFHWLGQEQWHWIHTFDSRMNIAGTGFEWLCAPLVLFTGYDRTLFLVNWVSYLLLPGLIYGVFIRLGVRKRVAWWWMWLLATGWCYAWQAESVLNDSFATIYALASVNFALRARHSGNISDWWLAILSAALMTGAKQTCLPLALVSLVAIWPGIRPLAARPWPTVLVLVIAVLVSFVPVTVMNLTHTGNWMGVNRGAYGWSNTTLDSPFWGILGNIFCLTAQNLVPPLFPFDVRWNAAMQHFVQSPWGSHFRSFEVFGMLRQSSHEGSAGIGMFICLLTLLSAWCARQHRAAPPAPAGQVGTLIRLLWLAPWLALLIFMAKVGSYENARQLAAYYVFFFPVLLAAPGHARLVRQRWWQRLGWLVSLSTLLMIATSRYSPLFPAQTFFGWLHETHPRSRMLAHVAFSFSCSQNALRIQRHAFQADLPADEREIGYYSIAESESEAGFWQPLGIRRVERILPGDTPAWVRSLNIHYVVLDDRALKFAKLTPESWMREFNAELVDQVVFDIRWGEQPKHLYLARLLPAPAR